MSALKSEVLHNSKTILFITSCPEIWGGSEELWGGAAVELRRRGHRIIAGRSEPARHWKRHTKWRALHAAGIEAGVFSVPPLLRAVPDAFYRYAPRLAPFFYGLRNRALSFWIRRLGADLVVIAQGNTFDGMDWVELPLVARAAGKPYVLVCQKNAESDWPFDEVRNRNQGHFLHARKAFFVSEHNRLVAECMMGSKLANAEIVRNPFMITTREPLSWPDASDGVLRLACVGRMWPREKGQDILLHVLARRKWRERPLQVDFFGTGVNEQGLAGMAQLLELNNVRFCGFTNDITEVWKNHHALVLPSRAEGLPLAQVEAMICGRVPIMTPAGGAAEILEDGVTGFLASSTSEEGFDEAMERAWNQRHQWREIGLKASQSIWKFYPADPCADFADKLEALLPISNLESQI
jgi:glycosyltransferase involved in cell wall biosynthesis